MSAMAILFHQRPVFPPTVAIEKRLSDNFRSDVRGAEAGRVKEKIYGYREDVLEGLKRGKRMSLVYGEVSAGGDV